MTNISIRIVPRTSEMNFSMMSKEESNYFVLIELRLRTLRDNINKPNKKTFDLFEQGILDGLINPELQRY